MAVKDYVCTVIGIVGGAIASLLGGWTGAMTTLILFMIIDYITGLVVAAVFHKSSKSESGALESHAGWKGLIKKVATLFFVLVAHRLDLMFATNYIRDAVVIGFAANELISIVENAGLMGVPIPKQIRNAIEILKSKADEGSD